jgi:hypothetical protein
MSYKSTTHAKAPELVLPVFVKRLVPHMTAIFERKIATEDYRLIDCSRNSWQFLPLINYVGFLANGVVNVW